MTPAITSVTKANIIFSVHEYKHNPNSQSYGEEAANALNLSPHQVFKTLVLKTSKQYLAVAIVPVSRQLNMKLMAKALGVKKLELAKPNEVERSSGYVLGGVSPLGQKQNLATIIDDSARAFKSIYVSAGKRGLELELCANDLARLTEAKFASIT